MGAFNHVRSEASEVAPQCVHMFNDVRWLSEKERQATVCGKNLGRFSVHLPVAEELRFVTTCLHRPRQSFSLVARGMQDCLKPHLPTWCVMLRKLIHANHMRVESRSTCCCSSVRCRSFTIPLLVYAKSPTCSLALDFSTTWHRSIPICLRDVLRPSPC